MNHTLFIYGNNSRKKWMINWTCHSYMAQKLRRTRMTDRLAIENVLFILKIFCLMIFDIWCQIYNNQINILKYKRDWTTNYEYFIQNMQTNSWKGNYWKNILKTDWTKILERQILLTYCVNRRHKIKVFYINYFPGTWKTPERPLP